MRDTIEMAHKSKLDIYGLGCPHDQFIEKVKAFEALVRADQREIDAKVCEDNATDLSEGDWDSACNNCADHIRTRGNT